MTILGEENQRLNLFRQILDPRTAGRALLGIARVKPFQIILKFLVGGLDEFLQRPRREVSVFVVDRLDARAINRQQLAPDRSSRRHKITKSRKTFLNAARLSLLNSAMVLKSGFKLRNSQMTSMLR